MRDDIELRADEPSPEVQRFLEERRAGIHPGASELHPDGARELFAAEYGTEEPITDVDEIHELLIPGPESAIPIRIYKPAGEGPFPVLIWFHGGGHVTGGLDSHDPTCRLLSTALEGIVIGVDYRLAPENKFPAALEDCYATMEWVVDNVETIHGDPDKLAFGGQSAGGNLTATASLLARDRGTIDPWAYQVLVYPRTDYDGRETKSFQENAEGFGYSAASAEWYWEQYIRSDIDARHPYASPMKARDLSGVPPATVITAGFDILRDQGIAYAERLENDGVDVTLRHYPGMIHGFFGLHSDPEIPQGKRAIEEVSTDLHSAFE